MTQHKATPVQHDTTRHNTTQHKATRVQHETTQHNTSEHESNTRQHGYNMSTKQHKIYFDLFYIIAVYSEPGILGSKPLLTWWTLENWKSLFPVTTKTELEISRQRYDAIVLLPFDLLK